MSLLCKLNELKIGQTAKIKKIETESSIKRRLLDIGLIPNSTIKCILKSPWNDPVAYEIKGTLIAIRTCDSKNILVEVIE